MYSILRDLLQGAGSWECGGRQGTSESHRAGCQRVGWGAGCWGECVGGVQLWGAGLGGAQAEYDAGGIPPSGTPQLHSEGLSNECVRSAKISYGNVPSLQSAHNGLGSHPQNTVDAFHCLNN